MRKLMLTLSVMLLALLSATAQDKVVTGKVTGEKNAPIEGVSVVTADAKYGTQTDKDGNYKLTVPSSTKALLFSYVNYETVSRNINKTGNLNVSLRSADKGIEEVIVVGYGTQKRKEVTGSISNIKGAIVAEKPVQSFDQALAGRAPGVQITVPSGVLNSPPVFRIRGTNSISLSSYPLIVVDGVPAYTGDFSGTNSAGNALASINPADIESIDIAKDAAATAIYGSRAANGVVFITTKKGKGGKARVSYNGSFGFTSAYGIPQVLNAQQYVDFKNLAVQNTGNPALINSTGSQYTKFALTTDAKGNTVDTRWADVVYRQGFSQDHNISVSGSNEGSSYYLGAGYSNQQGIVRKNDFIRKNVLANFDIKPNKVVTFGAKVSYSNEQNLAAATSGSLNGEAFNTGGFGRNILVNSPTVPVYKNDGTYNLSAGGNFVGQGANIVSGSATGGQVGFYNPQVALDLNRSNSEADHIQGNIYLQLKPFTWLTLKSLYGIDYINVDNEIFQTPLHGDGFTAIGSASSFYSKNKRWTWSNTAQIDYSIKRHNFLFLVGSEQDRRTLKGYGINRTQVSDPAYYTIQAGWLINNPSATTGNLGENYLLSTFGRFNYDFGKKYYLSANLRQDQYSALPGQREIFYGFSGAWDVAQEKFWKDNSVNRVVSSFKLHGSYGKVGNTSGIGDFASYSTFGSTIYGGAAGQIFNQAGNPNLKWETSKKLDYGVNIGFLKDRISLELTYYKNDISNLILNVPQSPSAGLPTTVPQNIGSMFNKGFEINLNLVPVRTKNFTWTSNFNMGINTNEVTALAPGLTEIIQATSGLEAVSRTAVGYSLGYLYLVKSYGVDPNTGSRIFLNKAGNKILYLPTQVNPLPAGRFNWSNEDGTRYIKPDGTPNIISQSADAVMYGNVLPKYVGGFSNNFKYKNFDLDVLFSYQYDFYVYYGTNAGLHDQRFWNNSVNVLTAWKKPGDITDVPRPVFGDNVSNGSGLPSSFNAFKGDFIKLKNVTLGYNFNVEALTKHKISNARFYVSGQNLAIFTKYPGPDPEVSSNGNTTTGQGIDRNTIANGRTILFGVNLSF